MVTLCQRPAYMVGIGSEPIRVLPGIFLNQSNPTWRQLNLRGTWIPRTIFRKPALICRMKQKALKEGNVLLFTGFLV